MSNRTSGNRQGQLFALSAAATIVVDADHPLVKLTDLVDWTLLVDCVMRIRRKKLRSRSGRPPRLRATVGVLMLMAVRKITYREAEDLVRYYAPARYLCGLTETTWTPDFTTVNDLALLLGEEGHRLLNETVVELAVGHGLAKPDIMVADTTAQEAAIPHPNEMGLMTAFASRVSRAAAKAGRLLRDFASYASKRAAAVAKSSRCYHLFAKTKPQKDEAVAAMADSIQTFHRRLGRALGKLKRLGRRCRGSTQRARKQLSRLHDTMTTLLPQIRHWLDTGKVARGKVLNLTLAGVYSVVRGKIGKKVEFGLNWGIRRLGGGFVLGTVAMSRTAFEDKKYAVQAVDEHIALFGKAPRDYAYDRGGYSDAAVRALQAKGVRNVAIAPTGKSRWRVNSRLRRRLVRERAKVEGSIGALKRPRYGFNQPSARTEEMMAAYGQRALLGFNLNKLLLGLTGTPIWATG